MEEKLKDLCSGIYIGTAMTMIEVLREEMGLGPAIQLAEKVWQRLGTRLALLIEEKYEIGTEKTLPKIIEALNLFLQEALGFESSITESGDNKAIIIIKPCLEWTKFKENRLPPLCYRMCYSLVESLVKQINMDINFQAGAQMRQGADRCELILTK
ncbi:MAG: L-2-amino-thiazoline-4-carboxylic acid hydrolase [Candidatus Helarchaeota archaeon]